MLPCPTGHGAYPTATSRQLRCSMPTRRPSISATTTSLIPGSCWATARELLRATGTRSESIGRIDDQRVAAIH